MFRTTELEVGVVFQFLENFFKNLGGFFYYRPSDEKVIRVLGRISITKRPNKKNNFHGTLS
jgi:hypothetical protein